MAKEKFPWQGCHDIVAGTKNFADVTATTSAGKDEDDKSRLINEDMEFLRRLDRRLRSVRHAVYKGHKIGVDNYTREKITEDQMEKVLRICEEDKDILFMPINTCMGFSVSYQIMKLDGPIFPGVPASAKLLLRFKEAQLPEDYTFELLSKTFMDEQNIKNAEFLGERIFNNREHYTY